MKRKFCYNCATKLEQKAEYVWWCPTCKYTQYANPKPCVDLALFNAEGQVLMAKRALEPDKGRLGLPGGFMEVDESIESALLREIKEELGLDSKDFTTPVYVDSRLHDYNFGVETYKNLVLIFRAELLGSEDKLDAQDDVESVEFRTVAELATPDVVSEEHLRTIRLAHKHHLKSK